MFVEIAVLRSDPLVRPEGLSLLCFFVRDPFKATVVLVQYSIISTIQYGIKLSYYFYHCDAIIIIIGVELLVRKCFEF